MISILMRTRSRTAPHLRGAFALIQLLAVFSFLLAPADSRASKLDVIDNGVAKAAIHGCSINSNALPEGS